MRWCWTLWNIPSDVTSIASDEAVPDLGNRSSTDRDVLPTAIADITIDEAAINVTYTREAQASQS